MVRRSFTYANFRLMRKTFTQAEDFLKELLGPKSNVEISANNLLIAYFDATNKSTFMNNLRAYIVRIFREISDQFPNESGPIKVDDNLEIYTVKEMPKSLAEFITGRYR